MKGLLKTLLAILILGGIGGAGFFFWKKQQGQQVQPGAAHADGQDHLLDRRAVRDPVPGAALQRRPDKPSQEGAGGTRCRGEHGSAWRGEI